MAAAADPGLLVFLAIGVLGGAHCLGMCGPLVTLYADRMGETATDGGHPTATHSPDRGVTFRELRQHLLFNLGRTLSYALLGALLGAVGMLVYDAAALATVAAPVRGIAGVLAGVGIAAAGLAYLRGGTAAAGHLPVGGLFARVSGTLTQRVDRWVRGPRILALGAIHGLLPCPILYPAFFYALAVGSPVRGALSLAVLGLGTIPTLLAYGTVFQSLDAGTRQSLHRVLGAAFLVLAYVPTSMGLNHLGIPAPMFGIPVYQPL
ncbi:MAG: sulfite exporter TauE/SafE family protein [Haloarculaceae archaeon]